VDNNHALAEKLSIHSVPAYLVLDKEGAVILRDGEAREWLLQKFGLSSGA
jgi:hypothetical protein